VYVRIKGRLEGTGGNLYHKSQNSVWGVSTPLPVLAKPTGDILLVLMHMTLKLACRLINPPC